MIKVKHARSMANELNYILDHVYVDNPLRFPVDVASLALEYSAKRFPDEPIAHVQGDDLPDFDGALLRSPRKKEWGIIYSNSVNSNGRIRFTLAHELGHYLLHRTKFPNGLSCSQWESLSSRLDQPTLMEREADEFASYLLMPLKDFHKQISPFEIPTFNQLSVCADRYGVSLTAAVVHWVNHTKIRAAVVISRDGFILWARSSKSALKSRAFFQTVNSHPEPLHPQSLPAREVWSLDLPVKHEPGIWFEEYCEEIAMFSHQHDFAISLLFLSSDRLNTKLEEESIEDAYDQLEKIVHGSTCRL